MVLQLNLGSIALILILVSVTLARYFLLRKSRSRHLKFYQEALQNQETFLKAFNVTRFDDFSLYDFELGRFSYVFPFPRLIEGEWRYRIYFSRSEAEDVATIIHEISECTIGRVIEKLLNLEKPLYLQRKENNKFWVHGKKQRYLVEHLITTLGEVDDLPFRKLTERLNKDDIKIWLSI